MWPETCTFTNNSGLTVDMSIKFYSCTIVRFNDPVPSDKRTESRSRLSVRGYQDNLCCHKLCYVHEHCMSLSVAVLESSLNFIPSWRLDWYMYPGKQWIEIKVSEHGELNLYISTAISLQLCGIQLLWSVVLKPWINSPAPPSVYTHDYWCVLCTDSPGIKTLTVPTCSSMGPW